MIEKSESNQLSLATAPILGQAPRADSDSNGSSGPKILTLALLFDLSPSQSDVHLLMLTVTHQPAVPAIVTDR
ncbi:MAG: hypothetical protein GY792_00345 [Gammaproteobacteria bacterium]|nr:hypothetical protein [Gammaproteobacteria bacterium]